MASGYFSSADLPVSERQKVIVALAASALLHVLGFLLLVFWAWLHPGTVTKPLENLKLLEVAVVPTPTPAPMRILPLQQPRATPEMIGSDGLKKSGKAPEHSVFQSDQNMVAGSEQPATGNVPMPSQSGKERPFMAFETKSFTLGNGTGGNAAPPVLTFAPAPAMPQMRAHPASPPMPTPEPQLPPTVEPLTAATPPIPKPAISAEPLYRPTPVPKPAPAATPDLAGPTPVPIPNPAEKVAMLRTPAPRTNPSKALQPVKPGYRPETEKNKIEGNISNRGGAGVDAIGTPVGRYRKQIGDAIGSRWYYYVKERMDLITTGSVRIKFYITQNGQVEDLKIISNQSNESLADYSVQSITAAKIPPIPPNLAPALDHGRYEVEFTFTIYPN